MSRKKILYLMHIDWRWIKQRPHFIAEGLSEYYQVKVVYFHSKHFLPTTNINTNKSTLKITPAFRLPFYQNKWIYKINKVFMQFYFKFLIKKYKPDFIWITFPQMYDYIPSDLNCKIIYDCMDLATGFGFSNEFKSKIKIIESKLVENASIIFASSNYIFNDLKIKHRCDNKMFLIRNAFSGEIIDSVEENPKTDEIVKIGYVGTISKWVDFEKIKNTLNKFKNVEYHLIGPWEVKNHLKNNKIKIHGVVDYNEIYNYVRDLDCLIVPFTLDKKIKSADPGKIYGYINYNKPIISVYYEELDYFSKFVYFYSNINELQDLMTKMIKKGFKKKYSSEERIKFLKENSWEIRVKKIIKCLNNL